MILDTHVWLWFVFGDDTLSAELRKTIERGMESVQVSAISYWELAVLVQGRRLQLNGPLEDFVNSLPIDFDYTVAPLTPSIAILSRTLKFEHSDPADRFIAATAFSLEKPLVTRDRRLLKLDWLETIEA